MTYESWLHDKYSYSVITACISGTTRLSFWNSHQLSTWYWTGTTEDMYYVRYKRFSVISWHYEQNRWQLTECPITPWDVRKSLLVLVIPFTPILAQVCQEGAEGADHVTGRLDRAHHLPGLLVVRSEQQLGWLDAETRSDTGNRKVYTKNPNAFCPTCRCRCEGGGTCRSRPAGARWGRWSGSRTGAATPPRLTILQSCTKTSKIRGARRRVFILKYVSITESKQLKDMF